MEVVLDPPVEIRVGQTAIGQHRPQLFDQLLVNSPT
jgi:hypothetical protein